MVFHLREEPDEYLPVRPVARPGRFHGQRDLRYVQRPAVGEGGVGIVELERRHLVLALADRLLHLVARLPHAVGVVLWVLGVLFCNDLRVGDKPG